MDLSAAIRQSTFPTIERGGFDAVVVGAGASGGLAAELLCEAGLKTLVLDAGWRDSFWSRPLDRALCTVVRFVSRPAAVRFLPSRVLWSAQRILHHAGRWRRPVQAGCYAWPTAPESFVDDLDNPYETPPDRPYRWIRARQLGGRMVVPAHGKQYYRHSDADFAPTDGLSPPWPLSIEDLDRWYRDVENRLELRGRTEGSRWIPDSLLTHPIEPNDTQASIIERIGSRWPDAEVILGRHAAPPNSLQSAALTGNLYCRLGAIGSAVRVDDKDRVRSVHFHDRQTGQNAKVSAPIVFLCASAFESVRILLNSQDERHPDGIGGRSGHLGRHVMDHVSIKVEGRIEGGAFGRSHMKTEDCVFLPKFDTRETNPARASRGYGIRLYVFPGPAGLSYFTAVSDSEMLPRKENIISLSAQTDRWGIPTLRISCAHGAQEIETAKEQERAVREIAEEFGVTLTGDRIERSVPGSSIHECGGARMGSDPSNSVLDPYNQCWEAKGLYVTDGAAFPSIGIQNPTLTIMALTARACDHAVRKA